MLPARRRVRCTSRGTFSHSSLEEMSTAIRASRSLMPPPPRLPLLPVVHGTENKQTLRPGSILVVLAGSVTSSDSSSRNFSAFARSPGLSAPGACGARTSLGPCRVFVFAAAVGKKRWGGGTRRARAAASTSCTLHLANRPALLMLFPSSPTFFFSALALT